MKVGKITDELKQQLIEQNDLREVAEEYGVIFNSTNKAKCPFHNDGKTGNLHLYEKHDENPTYHCYASTCSAGTVWADKEKTTRHTLTLPDGEVIEDGGPSVIGFIMNIEKCSFLEACIILAERAGIPLPEGKVNYKEERVKDRTTQLNKKYCKNLFSNPDILQYVYDRGITKLSIKKWRLGYISPTDTGNPNFGSKVAGRLVFGLKEEAYNTKTAKTAALAYRRMDDTDTSAKYFNDYTSSVYEKKHYLYGINEARKPMKKAGYGLVFEGYTDVIISHQSGLENSVAICGTAFTDEQMEKLRRITKNLIFWLDGDGPGIDNMMADIPRLLEKGFRVKIVIVHGQDPAEVMNMLGQDEKKVKQFIAKNARPALDVLAEQVIEDYEDDVRVLKQKYEAKINEKKVEALDELLPILDSIKDPSERIVFKAMINRNLGVNL